MELNDVTVSHAGPLVSMATLGSTPGRRLGLLVHMSAALAWLRRIIDDALAWRLRGDSHDTRLRAPRLLSWSVSPEATLVSIPEATASHVPSFDEHGKGLSQCKHPNLLH